MMSRANKLLMLVLALAPGLVSRFVVYTMRQSPKEAFIATDVTVQWAQVSNGSITTASPAPLGECPVRNVQLLRNS